MRQTDEELKNNLRMMNNKQVSKKYQVSIGTVCNWRRKLGVKKERAFEVREKIINAFKDDITLKSRTSIEDKIGVTKRQFVFFLQTTKRDDVLKITGVTLCTYYNWFKKYGIKRTRKTSVRKVLKHINKEGLIEKLKIFPPDKLAKQFGVTTSAMYYWFKKFNIHPQEYREFWV